jgi:hypothetical protein
MANNHVKKEQNMAGGPSKIALRILWSYVEEMAVLGGNIVYRTAEDEGALAPKYFCTTKDTVHYPLLYLLISDGRQYIGKAVRKDQGMYSG